MFEDTKRGMMGVLNAQTAMAAHSIVPHACANCSSCENLQHHSVAHHSILGSASVRINTPIDAMVRGIRYYILYPNAGLVAKCSGDVAQMGHAQHCPNQQN